MTNRKQPKNIEREKMSVEDLLQDSKRSILKELFNYKRYRDAANFAEKLGKYGLASKAYELTGDFYQSGRTAANAGLFKRASRLYEKVGVYVLAGENAEKAGQLERALELFQKPKIKAIQQICDALEKAGQLERALEFCLSEEKQNTGCHLEAVFRAISLSEKCGKIDKAIELCEKYKRYEKGAEIAERAGLVDKAINLYILAREGSWYYTKYSFKAAEIAEENGLFNKAIEIYIQLKSDCIAFEHAAKCAEKAGQLERAENLKNHAKKIRKEYDRCSVSGIPGVVDSAYQRFKFIPPKFEENRKDI